MGLLDSLFSGALKDVVGQLQSALAKGDLGDLRGLVAKLEQGGLGAQVKSWLSNGQNLPVTKDQLRAALGNEQVKQLAAHFGISTDSVLALLEKHLPDVVDKASPDGKLPPTA